jgi:hypothetical protein
MRSKWLVMVAAVLLLPGAAAAQEVVGAERIEIGSAIFSAGGGVRWFPIRHWGFRGDYRLMRIVRDETGPVPDGARIVRSAHRLYGAFVMTFGG